MTSLSVPFRQIRAHHTTSTVTVYQAYNAEIANAAVEHQKLNASSKFSTSRMTWIKPSWAWMLYRSGYSYKDPGQERILALTLKRETFVALLRKSITVCSHDEDLYDTVSRTKREDRGKPVQFRVQWDPERTVWLDKMAHRSIQIGVPGALVNELVEGIIEIEDVTERARGLKRILDKKEDVHMEELVNKGLVLEEKELIVDEDLHKTLNMDNAR